MKQNWNLGKAGGGGGGGGGEGMDIEFTNLPIT